MPTPPIPGQPEQSEPAPQKSSSSVWLWIIGLVVAGTLILGTGALFVTRFLVQRIAISRAGESVEINTPVGSVKATKDESADPGLPIYPGAKLAQAGGSVELGAPDEEAVSLTSAHYRTIDSIEKVDAWYREQLSADFKREGSGVMNHKKNINGILVKSDDIAYISEKDDLVRVVALQKGMNGVEIALLRVGKPEAQ
jgi:hypothetical protein